MFAQINRHTATTVGGVAPSSAGRASGAARLAAMAPTLLWALGVGTLTYRVASLWSSHLGLDLRPVYLAGRQLTDHHAIYDVANFVYSPSAALVLGAPMSAFGFGVVSHVALVVGAVLILATVALAARTVGRSATSFATAIGVVLVCLTGMVPETLFVENLSIVVAFVGAGAFLAWSRERYWLAGALLGLSVALKPLLLPLFLGLLVLRRWKTVATAGAVVLVANLAALAIDPRAANGSMRQLVDLLGDRGDFSGYFALFNSSLVGIGHLLGWARWVTFGLRGVIFATGAVGAAAIWRSRPEPARSLEAAGLFLACSYLASSDLEVHWIFALIPFAYASVLPGSPLRWWPVAIGGMFASELVILPQQLTDYGPYGTDTVVRGFGLCLVVVAVGVATVWPPLRRVAMRRPCRRAARSMKP